MVDVPIQNPQQQDIYGYGFDKFLNRSIQVPQSPLMYDEIQGQQQAQNVNFGNQIVGSSNVSITTDPTKGFWSGNAQFSNAPFSVDMSGNVIASSLTTTAAIIAANYSIGAGNVSTGDVVSFLNGGGVSTNIWIIDLYSTDYNVGDVAADTIGFRFTCPFPMSSFNFVITAKKVGSPTDQLRVRLWSDSAGPSIILQELDITVAVAYTDYTNAFTTALTDGTNYWLTIDRVGVVDAANYYQIKGANTNAYSGFFVPQSGTNQANVLPTFKFNTSSYTQGVYRTKDIPNNVGYQGNCVGVVSSVSGSNAYVVTSGEVTTSGLIVGSYLFASAAGGVPTTTQGTTMIGYAVSSTRLLVFGYKTSKLTFSSKTFCLQDTAGAPAAFNIMIGFLSKSAQGVSSNEVIKTSIGWSDLRNAGTPVTIGVKVDTSTSSSTTTTTKIIDTDQSGAATNGGSLTINSVSTINGYLVNVTFASSAPGVKRAVGTITFEN